MSREVEAAGDILKNVAVVGASLGTNRMFALVTASQIASTSAASFFRRLT
jgi:hypothetical protein